MERKNPFFIFCDSNETFIFMSKFSMEACPQMKYELVVQRKEGHNFSYHFPKRPKVATQKKLTFDIPNFKFQLELIKVSNLLVFSIKENCVG